MQFNFSLIGAGRLGGALAIALSNNGLNVVNVVSRTVQSAEKLAAQIKPQPQCFAASQIATIQFAEVVLICTPDSEIELTAVRLADNQSLAEKKTVFLHTSGALSSAVLSSLRMTGNSVGSLHPLVSVSDAQIGAANFGGAYFCLEGDAQAIEVAQKIVNLLQAHSFSLPTETKSLYHAAAVLSAGHLIALFDLAIDTLADCGLKRTEAQQILLPLVKSTVENLTRQAPVAALTGTFARADVETMKKHLASLKGKAAQSVYIELGKHSLELAAKQGANQKKLKEMKNILND